MCRCGGVEVCGCAGVEVWRCGGVHLMSGPTGEYTGWRDIILHGVDLAGRALGLEVVADLLAKEVLLQGGCAAGRRIRSKTSNIRSRRR
mgnify:CR=1 FL=1